MIPYHPPPADADRPSGRFHSTHWSQVLRAAAPHDPAARPALAELCGHYWYPLYAYHRRRGAAAEEAEDAVQAFFAWLLESGTLAHADQQRGRFRGFLVAAFRRFLAKRHEHATAAKRCPARPPVSIHGADGELLYGREVADHDTPERL
jgi:DNA-directed RNA polymerase specialized sigma24 family protein